MKNEQQSQKGQSAQGGKPGKGQDVKPAGDKIKNEEQGTPKKQQAGYSSAPEQQETKREQEDMHSERKLGNLDADRENAKPQEAEKPAGKSKVNGPGGKGSATKTGQSSAQARS